MREIERAVPAPMAMWARCRRAEHDGGRAMTPADCPFCQRIANDDGLLIKTSLAAAFFDTTPLSPGHVLIVPVRHEPDFLALSLDELDAILGVSKDVRAELDARLHPDGFNLGVNVGEAGGQTIDHSHLHLIPRYVGDVADPRGGIRWMIPDRAPYWERAHEGSTR